MPTHSSSSKTVIYLFIHPVDKALGVQEILIKFCFVYERLISSADVAFYVPVQEIKCYIGCIGCLVAITSWVHHPFPLLKVSFHLRYAVRVSTAF